MATMSSAPGDPRATTDEPQPREQQSPAELAAEQGVPARGASHYAKGTVANMMRSMAVIVAITMALFFVTGRPNSRTPESVDVASAAEHRAAEAGQPFSYPEDLPEGWVATNARYASSTGGVMAWNAGYTTPDGEYVSVQQAAAPGEEWVRTQTNNGRAVGRVSTEDGREWVKRDRQGKVQRSLVHDPESSSGLTTLVTGTGSWEQLEEFADRLVEAHPSGPAG